MFSEFNYIHRGKTMRKQAITHLGYIGERPGKDKEEIVRTLFGKGGPYTKEQVAEMIGEAPDNTLFWRLKLNPDPVLENPEKILNLEELTRDAVSWLERRLGKDGNPRNIPFIAAIHDDHTQLAHVHALLFIERNGREKPIDVSVINSFRDYVSLKAMLMAKARLTGRAENYLGQLQEQSALGIAMQAGRMAEATPTQTRDDVVSAGSGGGAERGETQGQEAKLRPARVSPQQPVRSVSSAPSTSALTAASSNAMSAAWQCGRALSSNKVGERRRSVNGLTDFNLEWDSFWSEYHAKRAEKHLHEAKFADLHLYKHMLKERPGVPSHILGNGYLNRHIKVYPSLHKREIGNVLDLGEGGLGKTNREKVEIANWEGSVVANDIKGELRRQTAGIRKLRFPQGRIITLNINGRGNQYDPLEGRNTERELYASAHHLLYREGERETYWTERATKMLTQLFLASREETRLIRRDNPFAKEVRPLPYVARMIRVGLNNVAARLNELSPELAQNFLEAEYVAMKDYEESKSRSDAWTTLTSRLYPLLTDEIVRSIDGSDFTAKDLLFSKDPVTVYLCWPEAELHSLLPLMRLVWEALTADIINTHDIYGHTTPQNILLSLDEAGRTGLTNLPDLLATFRSRQTYVSMSAQSLAQFKVHYGEYKTTVLLDNIQSLIIRRQKYDTARHVSDWLGARSGFALSRNKYSDDRHGEGETEREVPLFTPREIAELLDHQIIILHGGLKPIFANRVRRCDFPDVERLPHLQAPPPPLLPAPAPLPMLPAPIAYPDFPRLDRRYLRSGTYRLPAQALGYAIPLPPGGHSR